MILKEERLRDRAICEAAMRDLRVRVVDGKLCREKGGPIRDIGGEMLPPILAQAFSRWPAALDAIDEMERRIERIEEMATAWAWAAEKYTRSGEHDEARVCRAKSSALQGAARILRGEA